MSEGNDERASREVVDGGPDGVFEVIGPDGRVELFRPSDFDEIFTTADEHEAGRHVKLGWLLLDERAGEEGGKPALDTFFRRMAGRVLPGADDPQYEAPGHVTTYVLGYRKDVGSGTPAG
jgi:hypothetical protein